MRENDKLAQLLSRIPEEHFSISEKIITYAEKKMGTKLNEHIHIVLTDHLSFAIERTREGVYIQNKLMPEIKALYMKEFEIGLWALDYINQACQIELPKDEAAFIALHLHTMKPQGGDLSEIVRQTTIVRDLVKLIKKQLALDLKEDSVSYQRLITHLRFTLQRLGQDELHTMDEEMLAMIQRKFPVSYHHVLQIARNLRSKHGIKLPQHELGYITLHLERLQKS